MQCTPHKGHHNGCWMASPQDVDRVPPPFLPLKPYVAITIQRFKEDECVQWWEIFNEPKHDTYSLSLRNEAYKWAKAVGPLAPVMSCWDDSNNTDIVDHHDYGTAFKTGWQRALYVLRPSKGGRRHRGWKPVVPAGPAHQARCRDQPAGPGLAPHRAQLLMGTPGREGQGDCSLCAGCDGLLGADGAAMSCCCCCCCCTFSLLVFCCRRIAWTLLTCAMPFQVGNSNTRWHWNTPTGAPEPAIPWDAWVFPDGAPISHTEVAAFRR